MRSICKKCGGVCERFVCGECKRASKAAEARARRASGWVAPRLKVVHSCAGCGSAFQPRKITYSKYCSRDCAFKDSAKRFDTQAFRDALRLGRKPGARKFNRAKFKAHLKLGYRFEPRRWYTQQQASVCVTCGVMFTCIRGHSERCSDECRRTNVAVELRKERSLRKAKLRGLTAGSNIDPLVIFERDKWHCQGCGCWTPEALRGTYHDNAPELDHKCPIGKGGKHIERNLQLLCRVCNILKADMYWNHFKIKYL